MIPPKPAVFDPYHAPDGVECRWVDFVEQRPPITVRSAFVHTNGANGEGTVTSAWNWAHAKPNSNTCPHYQVDRKHDGVWARKMLPSNRKGIGNATVDGVQGGHGDVSLWSLVIETADLGWGPGKPGTAGGFEAEQGEMVARILAYEAIVHDFPLEIIDTWWGAGVAAHTDPFGYPYTTLYQGKPCPGDAKKRELREWIFPRAREIHEPWAGHPVVISPPLPDDEEDYLMAAIQAIYQPGPKVTRPNPKWFVLRADGGIRHASGPDVEHGRALKVPEYEIGGDEHYDQLDVASQK